MLANLSTELASAPPLGRVAVALDTDDWETFCTWCAGFGPRVGYLKVGLEAFVRWGPRAVAEAQRFGARIFLDLKLHDIPNTVAGAVRAAAAQGVSLLTVHAGGGPAMLAAAVAAAGDTVGLLGVTLLTHLDASQLEPLDLPGAAAVRVSRWAGVAREVGCTGVVCSPLEVGTLRQDLTRPFLLVTPGIRPEGSPAGDQRRVATPAQALDAGADLLVVGRPLTRAADPEAALSALRDEIAAAVAD